MLLLPFEDRIGIFADRKIDKIYFFDKSRIMTMRKSKQCIYDARYQRISKTADFFKIIKVNKKKFEKK